MLRAERHNNYPCQSLYLTVNLHCWSGGCLPCLFFVVPSSVNLELRYRITGVESQTLRPTQIAIFPPVLPASSTMIGHRDSKSRGGSSQKGDRPDWKKSLSSHTQLTADTIDLTLNSDDDESADAVRAADDVIASLSNKQSSRGKMLEQDCLLQDLFQQTDDDAENVTESSWMEHDEFNSALDLNEALEDLSETLEQSSRETLSKSGVPSPSAAPEMSLTRWIGRDRKHVKPVLGSGLSDDEASLDNDALFIVSRSGSAPALGMGAQNENLSRAARSSSDPSFALTADKREKVSDKLLKRKARKSKRSSRSGKKAEEASNTNPDRSGRSNNREPGSNKSRRSSSVPLERRKRRSSNASSKKQSSNGESIRAKLEVAPEGKLKNERGRRPRRSSIGALVEIRPDRERRRSRKLSIDGVSESKIKHDGNHPRSSSIGPVTENQRKLDRRRQRKLSIGNPSSEIPAEDRRSRSSSIGKLDGSKPKTNRRRPRRASLAI